MIMLQKLKITITTKEPAIDIALDTIRAGKQAFVFCSSKRSAEATTERIALKLKKMGNEECDILSKQVLKALPKPTRQCIRLSRCVRRCVSFHHSGLHHKQRELIEDNFRSGKIKVICCTPTLAYGVSLPAYRVIIKELKRYGGSWGSYWIPVMEYLQICGRAGRPEFNDKWGEAIAIAGTKNEKKAIYEKYILGESESIFSKLAVEPVLRMYLLSLISTEIVNSKKEIFDFFRKTFWAHQFSKDIEKMKRIVSKMLHLLEDFGFIKSSLKDEFVSANEIKDERYSATLIGKRVSELYIDPLTAHNIVVCLKKAAETGNTRPFAFLHMISNQLEMRPLLAVKNAEIDKINEKILNEELLIEEPPMFDVEYSEFLNSIKTAMFFEDWTNEKDDEYLLETYNIRPGETRVKLENADWLLYAAEELSKLLQLFPLVRELIRLRMRVKYGVKEELMPLLKLKGIGRVKGRALYNAGIKDIGDVKKADFLKLAQLIGIKTAIKIKEQVGQKFNQSS